MKMKTVYIENSLKKYLNDLRSDGFSVGLILGQVSKLTRNLNFKYICYFLTIISMLIRIPTNMTTSSILHEHRFRKIHSTQLV